MAGNGGEVAVERACRSLCKPTSALGVGDGQQVAVDVFCAREGISDPQPCGRGRIRNDLLCARPGKQHCGVVADEAVMEEVGRHRRPREVGVDGAVAGVVRRPGGGRRAENLAEVGDSHRFRLSKTRSADAIAAKIELTNDPATWRTAIFRTDGGTWSQRRRTSE